MKVVEQTSQRFCARLDDFLKNTVEALEKALLFWNPNQSASLVLQVDELSAEGVRVLQNFFSSDKQHYLREKKTTLELQCVNLQKGAIAAIKSPHSRGFSVRCVLMNVAEPIEDAGQLLLEGVPLTSLPVQYTGLSFYRHSALFDIEEEDAASEACYMN